MSRLTVLVMVLLGVAAAKEKPGGDPLPGFQPAPLPAKPLPVDDPKKATVVLFDDQADPLIPNLIHDGGSPLPVAVAEEVDVYSGATALRVTPLQRYSAHLPGWSYPIRKEPKAGEFRFVRFAWKTVGGSGAMVQFHDPANPWFVRYHAGQNPAEWESKQVATDAPTKWTVVTRDLFADFGEMTITGMAFTPMTGTYALFDHVMLGRTEADLDARSNELLGKATAGQKLDGKAREDAWAALGNRDWEKAGPALRALQSTATEQVKFVRERLAGEVPNADRERALRKRVAELVANLGDDDFDTRRTAEAELEKLGDAGREEIVEARKSSQAEVAYRARRLATRLKIGDTALLSAVRAARVVRVLDRAGTDEAKKLLAEMADGDFGPANAVAAKSLAARPVQK